LSTESHVDELIEMYALGALLPDERANVEQHLARCPRCRALVEEAWDAVTAIPRALEPVSPSPQMKRRLMARIDADLASTTPRPALLRTLRSSLSRVQRAFIALSPAIALASLVLVVIVGAYAWSMQSELDQKRVELTLLSQPGLHTTDLASTSVAPPGAQARLFLAPEHNTALLTLHGFKPLGPDQVYEFWLIRGQQALPAGVFSVDQSGTGRLVVQAAEPVGNFNQAGITIERAGGSQSPNLDALVFAGPIK